MLMPIRCCFAEFLGALDCNLHVFVKLLCFYQGAGVQCGFQELHVDCRRLLRKVVEALNA